MSTFSHVFTILEACFKFEHNYEVFLHKKRRYLRCAWRLVQCTVASPLLGVWTRNLSYHIHMGFEGLPNSEIWATTSKYWEDQEATAEWRNLICTELRVNENREVLIGMGVGPKIVVLTFNRKEPYVISWTVLPKRYSTIDSKVKTDK